MSLSKTIRFEVFKRDDFRCGYCGKTPPEVVLEVDHVIAKSAGGPDAIENLLTACFACNRGKRDVPLDKIPSSLSENLEVLQEKHQQLMEYERFLKKIKKLEDRRIEKIGAVFQEHFPDYHLSDSFKKISVHKFLQDLPFIEVEEAMRRACLKLPTRRNDAIKYFCGICWRKIKDDGREI